MSIIGQYTILRTNDINSDHYFLLLMLIYNLYKNKSKHTPVQLKWFLFFIFSA